MRLRLLVPALVLVPLLLAAAVGRRGGTPEQGRLYVANLRSSDVSIVDVATLREVARVPVPENPHEFAAAAGTTFVSNYRSAAVTRLSPEGGPSQTIAVSGEPHGLAVLGDKLAVTRGRAQAVSLLDRRDGSLLAEVAVDGEPHMVAAHGDRFYAVAAAGDALVEIDPDAGRALRRTAVGRLPESLAVSPDGRAIAVGNARSHDISLVDRASMVEHARIPVDGVPVRVLYSPGGRSLAVSLNDAGRVVVLDAMTGKARSSIAVGERPDGLVFSPDGRLLFVALTGDRRVAVVQLREARVIATVEVGDGPSGLLLAPF
jgi:YVTN family beta-propeller protein